jgi:DNA polymerase-3 subunit epsilon
MEKSIVWFDLETTGVNTTTDRIIEICMIKTDFDGNEIDSFYSLINPGLDTEWSLDAIEKHGITYNDVKDQPYFKDIASNIITFIHESSLGGYNALRFDIPMLAEECMRAGLVFNHRKFSVLDPFAIYSKYESRDLSTAYTKYTGKTLEGAHRAEIDIRATMEIFQAQRHLYKLADTAVDIDNEVNVFRKDVVDLSGKLRFTEIDGIRKIVFNFGKYSGVPFKDVLKKDSNYIDWIINKGEFSKETKIIIEKLKSY